MERAIKLLQQQMGKRARIEPKLAELKFDGEIRNPWVVEGVNPWMRKGAK